MKKIIILLIGSLFFLSGCFNGFKVETYTVIDNPMGEKENVMETLAKYDQLSFKEIGFFLDIYNEDKTEIEYNYYYSHDSENGDTVGYLNGKYEKDTPVFYVFYESSKKVYLEARKYTDTRKIYVETLSSKEEFLKKYTSDEFSKYNVHLEEFDFKRIYHYERDMRGDVYTHYTYEFTKEDGYLHEISFFGKKFDLIVYEVTFYSDYSISMEGTYQGSYFSFGHYKRAPFTGEYK